MACRNIGFDMVLTSFKDIEFTVQENRLWMLQCRSGKCIGTGAVKIVVDMVKEGLIDTCSAIKMVEPRHLDQLLHPQVGDLKIIFYIPSIVVTMFMTICWYYLLLRFYVSDCLKHFLPPFGLNETNSVCLILNLYEILEPRVFGCYMSYQFKDLLYPQQLPL